MRHWLLLAVLSLGCVVPVAVRAAVTDFSFVQITDSHFPSPGGRSEQTIPALASLGAVPLTPYGVTAPPPAFFLHTGDVTEFGALYGNAWANMLAATKQFPVPVYFTSGNHDSTWCPVRPYIRQRYGNVCYSFNAHGIHFIGLDTAGVLDPRPSIGPAELDWLRDDLATLDATVPVVLFFHHPYRTEESASAYDWDRLGDLLRPYNVVLLLSGHGHSASARQIDGFDEVQGGNTYQTPENPTPAGCNIISVQDGVLRVAYKRADEATASRKILEKRLPERAGYPRIAISQPQQAATLSGDTLEIAATIADAPTPMRSAAYDIDGSVRGALTAQDTTWLGQASLGSLLPGAHYCRVTFTDERGASYHRSTMFYLDRGEPKVRWRATLGDSSRATPLVADGVVYVGANNGRLAAFDARTGERRWTLEAGADITGSPLLVNDSIVFGTFDGKLSAVSRDGALRWTLALDAAIFSSPILVNGKVLAATASGTVYAVDAASGTKSWQQQVAKYSIEARPVASGATVYLGAWDQNIYAVNAADGALQWGLPSAGAQSKAGRYYSPADSSPVVAGDRVFVADRNYALSILRADTGALISAQQQCAAVGATRDGQAVYLRKTDGKLVKADLDGTPIWSVDAGMDSMPIPPVEDAGMVYTVTRKGLLAARSAADGTLRWQYQLTPQLYVYAEPVIDHDTLYITASDGTLTAIGLR